MTDYELKLGGGRVVTWTGHDGMSAAQAYANAHPGVTVFAWRGSLRRKPSTFGAETGYDQG